MMAGFDRDRRLKELEDQYRSKNELLQTDRGHMEGNGTKFMEIEL